ncbi:MAG: DNA repair protein RecN [Spirochaetes bacterium]|nr:DNA repair protein RecN [Spirochaetota bacterium]
MLDHLRIRNYALIEDLKINFQKGFNVLTGETGAGKSIIIGALNIILGEKASMENVRTGEEKAMIEAMFDISNNLQVESILEHSGIEHERGEMLILRREITVDKKSKNYVNSTPVPLSKLKEIGDFLVDIHGQHEHQSLLKINTHIELLDKFGHLEKEREELSISFEAYVQLKDTLEKLQMNEQEKTRLLELLKFSIEEIEIADLKAGEDIELDKEYNLLNNQEKLFQSVESSYNNLYGSESDLYSKLKETINILSDVEKYDSNIVSIKQNLEEAYYQVEDAVATLRDYKSSFQFSPERLESVIDRIELINKFKKKYGETVEKIVAYKEKSLMDLQAIEKSEEEIEKTKEAIRTKEGELNKLAVNLSGRRRVVAKLFEERIMEHLNDLDMQKSLFQVNIAYIEKPGGIVHIDEKQYKLSATGIDNIEFLIAPNVGEELKPLRKIVSGGEMSRIMLALKTVLNEVDKVNTLVFDEVDAGIGGKTSDVVGKKMDFLSRNKQVIVITHQAQISRYADKHFFILKEVVGDRTITRLKELSYDEKVQETARMIAGENITSTTLQHAKELIESA